MKTSFKILTDKEKIQELEAKLDAARRRISDLLCKASYKDEERMKICERERLSGHEQMGS